jgi:Uma2 family endonuclease
MSAHYRKYTGIQLERTGEDRYNLTYTIEEGDAMPAVEEKVRYTYADYLEWDESVHCELINGALVMMSPPVTSHQRVLSRLFLQLGKFLEGKAGEVFPAPFSLRLSPKNDLSDDTVFEPDITVVCDTSKIDEHGCIAAPDLIVEILSPSTARRDRTLKFSKYEEAGVREYWIADPEKKTLQMCILENGNYAISHYTPAATVPVHVLPGCEINLKSVFGY